MFEQLGTCVRLLLSVFCHSTDNSTARQMPFRWLSVSLTLAIFPLAESVYSALVNFASVSTLQAKSNTLDKALLCSLWQGCTPAPLYIAFVLQKEYRTHTNYLYNLQNSCYNVFTTLKLKISFFNRSCIFTSVKMRTSLFAFLLNVEKVFVW